jgi:hypothetical protein
MSNHFTVPVSSTGSPEGGSLDLVAGKLDRRRDSVAGLDLQNLGDVWSFVSGTSPHFEGVPRLHGVDAPLSQHAPMDAHPTARWAAAG